MHRFQKMFKIHIGIVFFCVMILTAACTSKQPSGNETEAVITDTPAPTDEDIPETTDTPAPTGEVIPETTGTPAPTGEVIPETTDTPAPYGEEKKDASAGDYDRLAGSVVKLEVYNDRGDRISTGSGFAVFDGSILITARHVVVNMDYMIATRDDGTTFRIDRLIDDDENSDICICALPEDAGLEPLVLMEGLPARGTEVFTISSQFGLVNLLTKGNVCGIWETEDVSMIIFTAPVSGGSSGAPLFDENGSVTGIVTGTYDKGQNLNIAAPAGAALSLYNQ